jgi:hypothetical protein
VKYFICSEPDKNQEDEYAATDCSETADSAKAPVGWDYSTGSAIGKGLYMISAYGWATMPFADYTGRKIAVPPDEIGIVIHRTYYKGLSEEKIIDFREGDEYVQEADTFEYLNKNRKVRRNGMERNFTKASTWNRSLGRETA